MATTKRTQTQSIIVTTERMNDQQREAVIRINENFRLLDSKIEKIWKEIEKLEEEE